MDAAVSQVMEHALLQAAQKIEDDLDEQIHKMENLDEDDLERLRQAKLKVPCSTFQCTVYIMWLHDIRVCTANGKEPGQARAMDPTRARGIQPHRNRERIFFCDERRSEDGLSFL